MEILIHLFPIILTSGNIILLLMVIMVGAYLLFKPITSLFSSL